MDGKKEQIQPQQAVIRHAQEDMAALRPQDVLGKPPERAQAREPEPEPKEAKPGRPSTASLLWAEWRRGLKDLQNVVLNAFPPGHVAQHEEPGTIANPTTTEIYQDRQADSSASMAGNDNRSDYEKALEASAAQAPQQSQERRQSRSM